MRAHTDVLKSIEKILIKSMNAVRLDSEAIIATRTLQGIENIVCLRVYMCVGGGIEGCWCMKC